MYYCNRVLGQSRALFSRSMLRAYARAGMDGLPAAVAPLQSVPYFAKVRVHRHRAPDSLVDTTMRAADGLAETDPELFKLLWIILATGLRRGEIVRARWENFQLVDGSLEYKSDAVGKDGERLRIPVIGSAWERLRPHRRDEGPILEGNAERVFRRLGLWMRDLGWPTTKKAHEFRNLIVSRIIAKYGMVTGSQFARHKDIRTTERFYSSYTRAKNLDVDL
jgi:integrase